MLSRAASIFLLCSRSSVSLYSVQRARSSSIHPWARVGRAGLPSPPLPRTNISLKLLFRLDMVLLQLVVELLEGLQILDDHPHLLHFLHRAKHRSQARQVRKEERARV